MKYFLLILLCIALPLLPACVGGGDGPETTSPLTDAPTETTDASDTDAPTETTDAPDTDAPDTDDGIHLPSIPF